MTGTSISAAIRRIQWDTMAKVLAAVSHAGFRKLQLVTDTEQGAGAHAQHPAQGG